MGFELRASHALKVGPAPSGNAETAAPAVSGSAIKIALAESLTQFIIVFSQGGATGTLTPNFIILNKGENLCALT
jgi:hypothetical protein